MILPSISWGSEFLLTSSGALRSSVAELGSTTLGEVPPRVAAWVSCCFSLSGVGVADVEHFATSRLLSLFGWVFAMPSGDRCPLPVTIFCLASADPRSWPSACFHLQFPQHHPSCKFRHHLWFLSQLRALLVPFLRVPSSSLSTIGCAPQLLYSPCLTWTFVFRLLTSVPTLLSADALVCLRMRACGLARWVTIPFPVVDLRHLSSSLSCVLCDAR